MKRRFLAVSVLSVCVLTALLAFVQQRPLLVWQQRHPPHATPVPEPSATLLLAGALGGIGVLEWRRRQRRGAVAPRDGGCDQKPRCGS